MRRSIFRTIALVLALVLCLGMTVMANPSPEKKKQIGTHGDEPIYGDITEVPDELEDATKKVPTEEGEKVIDFPYVIFDDDPADFNEPIKICFENKGVTEDTEGYIMIYDQQNDKWVKLETEIHDGRMCAVNIPKDLLNQDGTLFALVVDGKTYFPSSPQTSASSTAAVALFGIAAAAGAFGLKKKED